MHPEAVRCFACRQTIAIHTPSAVTALLCTPTPQYSALHTHLYAQALAGGLSRPPRPPPPQRSKHSLTTSVRPHHNAPHTPSPQVCSRQLLTGIPWLTCPSGAGSPADGVPGSQSPAPTGVAAHSAVPPPAWAACHAAAVSGATHDVAGLHVSPAHRGVAGAAVARARCQVSACELMQADVDPSECL